MNIFFFFLKFHNFFYLFQEKNHPQNLTGISLKTLISWTTEN